MTDYFHVPGASCQHCVRAITEEVSAIDGVQNVSVDLSDKRVRVEHGPQVSTETIVAAIREAGYEEVGVLA